MNHLLLLAEGVTTGQVALALSTVGITSLVGITTVCVTHWLAKSRDVRANKLERIERLFLSSREMIYDFQYVATHFRPAAEEQMSARNALKEISAVVDEVYSVGTGERPYYRVQMLIEVYFRHMKPWLGRVDAAEIRLRNAMKDQDRHRPNEVYEHGGSTAAIINAENVYTTAALEMTELIRKEAAKLDDWSWPKWPRLAPR